MNTRNFAISTALLLGLTAIAAAPAAAQRSGTAPAPAQRVGTFFETCSAVALSADKKSISATCKKIDGSANSTSLVLSGVQNVDGRLTFVQGPSNYTESCSVVNLTIPTKANGLRSPALSAVCKRRNGTAPATTSLVLPIENINGVLTMVR